MPKGRNLTEDLKQRMYNSLCVEKDSIEECFKKIFYEDINLVSSNHLTYMKYWFESHNIDEIALYINGKSHSGSSKRKLQSGDDKVIGKLAKQ